MQRLFRTFPPVARLGVLLVVLLALDPTMAVSMAKKSKSISSDDAGQTSADSRVATRVGVAGIVRTAGGTPAAGIVVFAKSLDRPGKPIPEIAIVSGADGAYFWPLKPGRYELTALVDGRRGPPGVVTVPKGGAAQLDLTLPQ